MSLSSSPMATTCRSFCSFSKIVISVGFYHPSGVLLGGERKNGEDGEIDLPKVQARSINSSVGVR